MSSDLVLGSDSAILIGKVFLIGLTFHCPLWVHLLCETNLMLFPEVWGRISFRCTHKLHCVFALIDCTRMVQFLTAIPFLFYYYVDDRAVGNGGGHRVFK